MFHHQVYNKNNLTILDPSLEEGFPGKKSGISGPSETYQLTLAARIFIPNSNPDIGIFSKGTLKDPAFNILYTEEKGFIANFSTDSLGKITLSTGSITAGEYKYIILIYDGHVATLYLDGIQKDTAIVNGKLTTNYEPFYIGEAPGFYLNSDVIISSTLISVEALSGTQIYDYIYGTSFSEVVTRDPRDQKIATYIPPGLPSVEAFWYGRDGDKYNFSYEGKLSVSQGGVGYTMPDSATWDYFLSKVIKPSIEYLSGVLGISTVRLPLSWNVWEAFSGTDIQPTSSNRFINRFKDVVNTISDAGMMTIPILWSNRGHPGDNSLSSACTILLVGDQSNPGNVLVNKFETSPQGGYPGEQKTLSDYDNFIGPYKVNYLACTSMEVANAVTNNLNKFYPLKNIRAGIESDIIVNGDFEYIFSDKYGHPLQGNPCQPSDGNPILDGSYWRGVFDGTGSTTILNDSTNPYGAYTGSAYARLVVNENKYVSAILQGHMNHFDHITKHGGLLNGLSYIHLPPGGNYKLSFRAVPQEYKFDPVKHKLVVLIARENSGWKELSASQYWDPDEQTWTNFSDGTNTDGTNTDLFQNSSGLADEWIEIEPIEDNGEWQYRNITFYTDYSFYDYIDPNTTDTNEKEFLANYNPDGFSGNLPFLSSEIPDGYTIAIGLYSVDGTNGEIFIDDVQMRILATDYDVRAHFNPRNNTGKRFYPAEDTLFTLQDIINPRTAGYGSPYTYDASNDHAGYLFRKDAKNSLDLDSDPIQLQNPGIRNIRLGLEFFKKTNKASLSFINTNNINGGDLYLDQVIDAIYELGEDKFFAIELFDRPFDMRRLGVTNEVDATEMEASPYGSAFYYPSAVADVDKGSRWPICDEYYDIARFIDYTRKRIEDSGKVDDLPLYISPRRSYVYNANLINTDPENNAIIESSEKSTPLLEIENSACAKDTNQGVKGAISRHLPITVYGMVNSAFRSNNNNEEDGYRLASLFGTLTKIEEEKKHDLWGIGRLTILSKDINGSIDEISPTTLNEYGRKKGAISFGFLPKLTDTFDFGSFIPSVSASSIASAFSLLQRSHRTAGVIDDSFIIYGKEGDKIIRDDDGAQWQWFIQDLSAHTIDPTPRGRYISQKDKPTNSQELSVTSFTDLASIDDFDLTKMGMLAFELTDTPIDISNQIITDIVAKEWIEAYVFLADSVSWSPHNLFITEVGAHREEIINPEENHTYYTSSLIFPNIPISNTFSKKIPWILRTGSLINVAGFFNMPSGTEGYGSAGAMGSLGYISTTAGTMGSRGFIYEDEALLGMLGMESALNWAIGSIYEGAKGWQETAISIFGVISDSNVFTYSDIPDGNTKKIVSVDSYGYALENIIEYWNNNLISSKSLLETIEGLSLAMLRESRGMPETVSIPKFLSPLIRHVYLGQNHAEITPTFVFDDSDLDNISDSQFQYSIRIGSENKISISMFAARSGTATVDIPLRTETRFTGIDIEGNYSALGIYDDPTTTFTLSFNDLETKILYLTYEIPGIPISDNDCSHLWGILGDFWGNFFNDRDAVCALWNAYIDNISNILLHLYQYDSGKSITSVPVNIAGTNTAFVQDSNLLVSGSLSELKYYVNSELKSIPVLNELISSKGTQYFENQDYTINDGIWTILNSSMPQNIFAHRLLYDEKILYKNYGFLINILRNSSQNYKDIIQSAWNLFWNAITPARVTAFVQSMLGLPIIPLNTTVSGYRLELGQHILTLESKFDGKREISTPLFIAPSEDNPIKVIENGEEIEISSYTELVGLDLDSGIYPIVPFPSVDDWKTNSTLIQKISSALRKRGAEITRTFFIRIPFDYYSYLVKELISSGTISDFSEFTADTDKVLGAARIASAKHMFLFETPDNQTLSLYKEDPDFTLYLDFTLRLSHNYFFYHIVNGIPKEWTIEGSKYYIDSRQNKLIVLRDDEQAKEKSWNGQVWPELITSYTAMESYLIDENNYGRRDSSPRGLREAIGISHSGDVSAIPYYEGSQDPIIELEKEEKYDSRKFATLNFDETGPSGNVLGEHEGIQAYGDSPVSSYIHGSNIVPWTMMNFNGLPETQFMKEYFNPQRFSVQQMHPNDFEFYDERWVVTNNSSYIETKIKNLADDVNYSAALRSNKGFFYNAFYQNSSDSCTLHRNHRLVQDIAVRSQFTKNAQEISLNMEAGQIWDTVTTEFDFKIPRWDIEPGGTAGHMTLIKWAGYQAKTLTYLGVYYLPPDQMGFFFYYAYPQFPLGPLEYWYFPADMVVTIDEWVKVTAKLRSDKTIYPTPSGYLYLKVLSSSLDKTWQSDTPILTTSYGIGGKYHEGEDYDRVALHVSNEQIDQLDTVQGAATPNPNQRPIVIVDHCKFEELYEGELIDDEFDHVNDSLEFRNWDFKSISAEVGPTAGVEDEGKYTFNSSNIPKQLDDATKIYGEVYKLSYSFKYLPVDFIINQVDTSPLTLWSTNTNSAIPIFGIQLYDPTATEPTTGFGVYIQNLNGIQTVFAGFNYASDKHFIAKVLDPNMGYGDLTLSNPIDFNITIDILSDRIVFRISVFQLQNNGTPFNFTKTEVTTWDGLSDNTGTGIILGLIDDENLLSAWNTNYIAREFYGPKIFDINVDSIMADHIQLPPPNTTWFGSAYVFDIKSYVSIIEEEAPSPFGSNFISLGQEFFTETDWYEQSHGVWDYYAEENNAVISGDGKTGILYANNELGSKCYAYILKGLERELITTFKFRIDKPIIFNADTDFVFYKFGKGSFIDPNYQEEELYTVGIRGQGGNLYFRSETNTGTVLYEKESSYQFKNLIGKYIDIKIKTYFNSPGINNGIIEIYTKAPSSNIYHIRLEDVGVNFMAFDASKVGTSYIICQNNMDANFQQARFVFDNYKYGYISSGTYAWNTWFSEEFDNYVWWQNTYSWNNFVESNGSIGYYPSSEEGYLECDVNPNDNAAVQSIAGQYPDSREVEVIFKFRYIKDIGPESNISIFSFRSMDGLSVYDGLSMGMVSQNGTIYFNQLKSYPPYYGAYIYPTNQLDLSKNVNMWFRIRVKYHNPNTQDGELHFWTSPLTNPDKNDWNDWEERLSLLNTYTLEYSSDRDKRIVLRCHNLGGGYAAWHIFDHFSIEENVYEPPAPPTGFKLSEAIPVQPEYIPVESGYIFSGHGSGIYEIDSSGTKSVTNLYGSNNIIVRVLGNKKDDSQTLLPASNTSEGWNLILDRRLETEKSFAISAYPKLITGSDYNYGLLGYSTLSLLGQSNLIGSSYATFEDLGPNTLETINLNRLLYGNIIDLSFYLKIDWHNSYLHDGHMLRLCQCLTGGDDQEGNYDGRLRLFDLILQGKYSLTSSSGFDKKPDIYLRTLDKYGPTITGSNDYIENIDLENGVFIRIVSNLFYPQKELHTKLYVNGEEKIYLIDDIIEGLYTYQPNKAGTSIFGLAGISSLELGLVTLNVSGGNWHLIEEIARPVQYNDGRFTGIYGNGPVETIFKDIKCTASINNYSTYWSLNKSYNTSLQNDAIWGLFYTMPNNKIIDKDNVYDLSPMLALKKAIIINRGMEKGINTDRLKTASYPARYVDPTNLFDIPMESEHSSGLFFRDSFNG